MSKKIIMARMCITCKEEKSTEEFHSYKYTTNAGNRSTRFDSRCKICNNLRRKKQRSTPEAKAYNNKKCKEWYSKNKERQKEYRKQRQQLPEHRANKAKAQRMRKARIRASSDNKDKRIAELYAEAMRLERETGTKMHVDHIMPLCLGGKHVYENLQILTAHENLTKGGTMPADVVLDVNV